jgi:CubicO group peptidase (beta-lactamase class C family)
LSENRSVSAADGTTVGFSWNGLGSYDTMRANGFRIGRVGDGGRVAYTSAGDAVLEHDGVDLWVSDNEASQALDVRTYAFGTPELEAAWMADPIPPQPGMRPYDIECRPQENPLVFLSTPTLAWRYDDERIADTIIAPPTNTSGTQDRLDWAAANGYRPIAIDNVPAYLNLVEMTHCLVLVQDVVPASNQWAVSMDIEGRDELAADVASRWAQGFFPMDVAQRFSQDNIPTYDVIYYDVLQEQSVRAEMNLSTVELQALDVSLRRTGYHASVMVDMDGTSDNWLSVWTKFEDYSRVTAGSTILDPSDPLFPVHQQLDQLTAGFLPGGGAGRDSSAATLHVVEGGTVTVSRSYTNGPAIHPESPLDATAGLASVSKSVTALAVALALNESGTPYSATVSGILGWTGGTASLPSDPGQQATLLAQSVDSTLRMVAGFNMWGIFDHFTLNTQAGAAGLSVTYPFDTRDYRAIVESALDQNAVWSTGLQGTFVYSNQGYNLLGGVVEQLSGTATMEAYLDSRFIAPLGLSSFEKLTEVQSQIATRDLPRGRASSHLTNWNHPYRNDTTPVGVSQDPLPTDLSNALNWYQASTNGHPESSASALRGVFGGRFTVGEGSFPSGGMAMSGADAVKLLRAVSLPGASGVPAEFPAPSVFSPLWTITGTVPNSSPVGGTRYERGFYRIGNWVVMLGNHDGITGAVAFNPVYDFGFAILTNGGKGPQTLLTAGTGACATGGAIQTTFTCVDDLVVTPALNECSIGIGFTATTPGVPCG